jgi:hypothetical protein
MQTENQVTLALLKAKYFQSKSGTVIFPYKTRKNGSVALVGVIIDDVYNTPPDGPLTPPFDLVDYNSWDDVIQSINPGTTINVNADRRAVPVFSPYKRVLIPGGYTSDPMAAGRAIVQWLTQSTPPPQPLDIRVAAEIKPAPEAVTLTTVDQPALTTALVRSRNMMNDIPLTTSPSDQASEQFPIPVSAAMAFVALGGSLADRDLDHAEILANLEISPQGFITAVPTVVPRPIAYTGGPVTRAIIRAVNTHPDHAPSIGTVLTFIRGNANRVITREQLIFLVSELQGLKIQNDRVVQYVYTV